MKRKAPIRNFKLFEQYIPGPEVYDPYPKPHDGVLPDSDAPRHPPFPKIGFDAKKDGTGDNRDSDDFLNKMMCWMSEIMQDMACNGTHTGYFGCQGDDCTIVHTNPTQCADATAYLDEWCKGDKPGPGPGPGPSVLASESYNQPCRSCGPQQLDEGWLGWAIKKLLGIIIKNPPGTLPLPQVSASAQMMPNIGSIGSSVRESFEPLNEQWDGWKYNIINAIRTLGWDDWQMFLNDLQNKNPYAPGGDLVIRRHVDKDGRPINFTVPEDAKESFESQWNRENQLKEQRFQTSGTAPKRHDIIVDNLPKGWQPPVYDGPPTWSNANLTTQAGPSYGDDALDWLKPGMKGWRPPTNFPTQPKPNLTDPITTGSEVHTPIGKYKDIVSQLQRFARRGGNRRGGNRSYGNRY